VKLTDERLDISRDLSELDRKVVEFLSILDDVDVRYVVVSGYVAILTGRSRGTEDVDVVLEPLSDAETEALAERFDSDGYWGTAMPLEDMQMMLSDGDRFRIAEEGEFVPNFEMWFAKNDIERRILDDPLLADLGDNEFPISPIETQIAFKLYLAQSDGSTRGKDFEDALHLYTAFGDALNTEALQSWVEELEVEEYYGELRDA
jgi:hypothetical protein